MWNTQDVLLLFFFQMNIIGAFSNNTKMKNSCKLIDIKRSQHIPLSVSIQMFVLQYVSGNP